MRTATLRQVPQDARAAIYCRINDDRTGDELGVARQEKLARQTCARLGLAVEDRHVYVDNSRSAWRRNRKRPGWDALLAAVAAREVTHIVCYDPDRLMRQPRDLDVLPRVVG